MRTKSGRIINIGSVSGVAGNAGQANYAASKAGLIGLSKTVARELAGKGITCNVVAPGFITTDMTDVLNDKIKETVKRSIPLRRFGEPQEIAAAVCFPRQPRGRLHHRAGDLRGRRDGDVRGCQLSVAGSARMFGIADNEDTG